MSKGIGVVGLYVHDQDEALDFYVNKLGFQVHADARNGAYRWLTVKHPNQPTIELGLFAPQEPVMDAATLVFSVPAAAAQALLPGDAFEIGALCVRQLPPWNRAPVRELLLSDDLFAKAGELAGLGGAPWGGFAMAAATGAVWAFGTVALASLPVMICRELSVVIDSRS